MEPLERERALAQSRGLASECEALGLRVTGLGDPLVLPGGVVVKATYRHKALGVLCGRGYLTAPSGPRHYIIEPRGRAKPGG